MQLLLVLFLASLILKMVKEVQERLVVLLQAELGVVKCCLLFLFMVQLFLHSYGYLENYLVKSSN